MATDCDLGARVVIPRAGEMLAERRSPPLEDGTCNGVIGGGRGRGAGGRGRSCSTKCKYDDCCLFHGK